MPIMILHNLMLQESGRHPLIFHHMHHQMKQCSTIHLSQQMHYPWTFLLPLYMCHELLHLLILLHTLLCTCLHEMLAHSLILLELLYLCRCHPLILPDLLLIHLCTCDEFPHDALILLLHLRHTYIC